MSKITATITTRAKTTAAIVASAWFNRAKRLQRFNKNPPGLTCAGRTTPPTSKSTMMLKAIATRLKRIMILRLKTFIV
jgi:hypothetical protein